VRTPETDAYWAAFRDATGCAGGRYDVVAFGGGPPLADELAALVLEGRKRATAMLERDVMAGTETPAIGGYFVVVDGAGRPVCVARTMELRLGPLDSVDEAFAWDEGEGDRTREDWLRGHRAFFQALAEREGFEMHDRIGVVFERFRVVWPPEAADG
jgi:uncharacterized protein YhfF